MGVNKTSDICSGELHWVAAGVSRRASTADVYAI